MLNFYNHEIKYGFHEFINIQVSSYGNIIHVGMYIMYENQELIKVESMPKLIN